MKRFVVGIALALVSSPFVQAQVAFPGAEGFGAKATGGRGGTIYIVNNLEDQGPGSLRDALSQPDRIVVFGVSGIIQSKSAISSEANITILGQTAPGEGVTVFGNVISFSGKENVIVRYLRFRSSIASSRGSKTLNLTDGGNMVFDHLSISWGRWDNLGFTKGSHDVTLQDCIISEAIDPQRFGALIDSADRISVLRNLWMSNQSRNPKGKAHMQYINNVVYNWGASGYVGGHSAAVWNQDLINNYFIKGPNSRDAVLSMFNGNDHVYHSGNLFDADLDGTLNGRAIEAKDFDGNKPEEVPTFKDAIFNKPEVAATVLSAEQAFEHVASSAGASLRRDAIDRRLIEELRSLGKSGKTIRTEEEVSGIGTLSAGDTPADADQDGLPDAWETAHGLNPGDGSDSAKIDPKTDYAHIELYANSLVEKPADAK